MSLATDPGSSSPNHEGSKAEYTYRDEDGGVIQSHHRFLLGPVQRRLSAAGARTVLDVGCGTGSFARSLTAAGFEVYGCDTSKSGIAIAQKHAPERFRLGSAYDDMTALFPSAPRFDAIVAAEVVEHLFAPRDLVARVREALVPGGLLVLTTPYHGYLKNLALALSGKMDAHFSALWDGGHIKFWSKQTLSELLREQHFQAITFDGAGRVPLLWKAMIMTARAPG
jgi:2-polyprenyl-3-methyl-5-hydroxy-6-metoxy-1,4-benzoquinol methylase